MPRTGSIRISRSARRLCSRAGPPKAGEHHNDQDLLQVRIKVGQSFFKRLLTHELSFGTSSTT